MAARITTRGQITVPRRVRAALQLSAGDAVEFYLNGNGEFVLRKVTVATPEDPEPGSRRLHPRVEAQMRRRAEELLALLRGLD
jgi:antitoxin PrlF